MVRLAESLQVCDSDAFRDVVKREIAQLDIDALPLQQALRSSSHVQGDRFDVVVLGVAQLADVIRVRAGIFYTGIVAGCSCADDPSPVNENNEYCELQFDINRDNGETEITLLDS